MADDGMLLNFELPSDAFAPKQTFKGGRWKDRLAAKKFAQLGSGRSNIPKRIPRFDEVRSEDEELILPDEPSSKRLKFDQQPQPASTQTGRPRFDESRQQRPPREVVSSLFTYNPESSIVTAESVHEASDVVEPSNAPLQDDLAGFTGLGLSSTMAKHLLTKLEIKMPTAIQRKAIEQLCRHDTDAFIQAETGSGKTLAYLLPVLQRITDLSQQMKDRGETFDRQSGLFALILAPTRELSKQISAVLESLLSCCHWIVGGIVIGGEKKKSEKARLRKGVNVLVATPGRLADHLDNTEVLDVSKIRWLVLDEGDRLMELGFEQDIQKITSVMNLRSKKALDKPVPSLPERRTTVLCSATLKSEVEHLSNITLRNPEMISIDLADATAGHGMDAQPHAFSAPSQLKQSYAVVPPKQRLVSLVAALKQTFRRKGSVMKCVLFISCADSVDFHFELLTAKSTPSNAGVPIAAESPETASTVTTSKPGKIAQGQTITETRTQGYGTAISSRDNPVQVFRLHGSLQQATRTSTLKAFTTCIDASVLVCTDVASRGLDVPNIDLVIEYDPPFSKEDHLHRIGRTARAGKDGRAMIFLMPGCEEGYVDILKEGRPRIFTRHDASELLKKGFSATTGVVNANDWQGRATDWQLGIERWALEHPRHLEQARKAFQSHVRAYATHVAAERGIFDMQQLHLGHLAKAFALRDKPGSLRVPGLRPGEDARKKTKDARRIKAAADAAPNVQRARGPADTDAAPLSDQQEARRKMQAMSRGLGGASEFNLG